jgi:hypothetical protein
VVVVAASGGVLSLAGVVRWCWHDIVDERAVPWRPIAAAMPVIACPDWMRRSQASVEFLKVPSSFGISRVALLPSKDRRLLGRILRLSTLAGLCPDGAVPQ